MPQAADGARQAAAAAQQAGSAAWQTASAARQAASAAWLAASIAPQAAAATWHNSLSRQSYGILCNPMESHGIYWDSIEINEIIWNSKRFLALERSRWPVRHLRSLWRTAATP